MTAHSLQENFSLSKAELAHKTELYFAGLNLLLKYLQTFVRVDSGRSVKNYEIKSTTPVSLVQELLTTKLAERIKMFDFKRITDQNVAMKVAEEIASLVPSSCNPHGDCKINFLYEEFTMLRYRAVDYLEVNGDKDTSRFFQVEDLTLIESSNRLAQVVDIVNDHGTFKN